MSDEDPGRRRPAEEEEHSEGWEALEEDASEGRLRPNPELEDAMREAAEALEGRDERPETARGSGAPAGEAGGELAALRDRHLRLQAEFENFRRRTLREREEAYQYGALPFLRDLLPTVDNLERALEAAQQAGSGEEALREGVELVMRELRGVLAKHGVQEIEAEGQPFDPARHEALAQAPDDSVPPNTVVQVVQRGFLLRDRLLRPARVIVSRPSSSE